MKLWILSNLLNREIGGVEAVTLLETVDCALPEVISELTAGYAPMIKANIGRIKRNRRLGGLFLIRFLIDSSFRRLKREER